MLAYALEVLALGCHVVLDLAYGLRAALLRGHEVSCRIYGDFVKLVDEGSCERVDYGDLLYLVSEELYADCVLSVSYADVDGVSAYPECSSLEVGFSTAVERVHKLVQQPCHASLLAAFHQDCLLMEVGRVADTIKA